MGTTCYVWIGLKRSNNFSWVMTSKNIMESCSLNFGYLSKSLLWLRALLSPYKTRLWNCVPEESGFVLDRAGEFFFCRNHRYPLRSSPNPLPSKYRGHFYSGVNHAGRETVHSPQSLPRSRYTWSGTFVPRCLYGISDLNPDKRSTLTP
jgi:hypothetical protein